MNAFDILAQIISPDSPLLKSIIQIEIDDYQFTRYKHESDQEYAARISFLVADRTFVESGLGMAQD